ncbi:hypothetical protein [Pedobacter hiemivivus]|uniref:hypothetical protein n=1 Tax=Pedobacter hiemivivus TaxID=2530454 RepID=UPI00146BC2C9|nr:hypothetical protein [Pedobacter hiemivivus]
MNNYSKKEKWHENQNETDRIPKNMGGHLSLDYLCPSPAQQIEYGNSALPQNVFTHAGFGTLDGVHRCPFGGCADQNSFREGKTKRKLIDN